MLPRFVRYLAYRPSNLEYRHIIPKIRTMSHIAMAQRLANKTILITGASSGIGRATAFEFSRTSPDIKLIITARRIETLRAVAAEIEAESKGRTKVLPVQFDVSSPSAVRGFLDDLPEGWNDIDVLVNNAYGFYASFDGVVELT